MGFYDAGGGHQEVFDIFCLCFGLLGSIFSILTIALIHKLNLYNGHVILVLGIAIGELFYDLCFMYNGKISTWYLAVLQGVMLGSGLAVDIYTNVMATCILTTVFRRKSLNVLRFQWYIHGVVLLVLGCSLLFTFLSNELYYLYAELYFWYRWFSIGYNFIAFAASWYILNQLVGAGMKTVQEKALYVLATSIQYYPMIQAIGRLPLLLYKESYGRQYSPPSITTQQFVCQIGIAVITPSTAIGYFLLFLFMQRNALHTFKSWFPRWMVGQHVPRGSDSAGVVTMVSTDDGTYKSPSNDSSQGPLSPGYTEDGESEDDDTSVDLDSYRQSAYSDMLSYSDDELMKMLENEPLLLTHN